MALWYNQMFINSREISLPRKINNGFTTRPPSPHQLDPDHMMHKQSQYQDWLSQLSKAQEIPLGQNVFPYFPLKIKKHFLMGILARWC